MMTLIQEVKIHPRQNNKITIPKTSLYFSQGRDRINKISGELKFENGK